MIQPHSESSDQPDATVSSTNTKTPHEQARQGFGHPHAAGPTAGAEAEDSLSAAVRTLFAVAEAYPNLQADRSFAALQAELAATEDLIAAARTAYNEVVLNFNTMTQRVPMNLVSFAMGMSPLEYFEASTGPVGPSSVQF